MDLVFDFNEANTYHRWLQKPHNQVATELENRLMLDLIGPHKGESVLDIGCGTGASLRPFLDQGLEATGLDPSPYMLDIALSNLGQRVDLYRGFGNNLPFEDNAFNYACLNLTMEFMDRPYRALQEACRVAKDKVYIGFLNPFAVKNIQRRIKGVFTSTIYNRAHFFSIWQVKNMVRAVLGDVPIAWRTACHMPAGKGRLYKRIEGWHIVQRCPTGTYAALTAVAVPRFKTRPLAIKYGAKQTPDVVTG
jgi:SAM-dependent methyltransferase